MVSWYGNINRFGARLLFVLLSTAIVVVFSEKAYWYVQGYIENFVLELIVWYFFPTAAFLCAMEHFRVRRIAPIFLCGALFGLCVEGVLVPVIYEGGLWNWWAVSYTPLAWHAPISVVFGWYLIRKLLLQGSWTRLLLASVAFGLFFSCWSLVYWLPENINDPEHIKAGYKVGVWPVTDFALYAFAITLVLALCHWLLGKAAWMSEFRPSAIEKGFVALLIACVALARAPEVGIAWIKLPVVLAVLLLALWSNRRHEGGLNVIEELRGSVKLSRALALFLIPVVATATYGVAVLIRPSERLIRSILLEGIVASTYYAGWALFLAAVVVCLRPMLGKGKRPITALLALALLLPVLPGVMRPSAVAQAVSLGSQAQGGTLRNGLTFYASMDNLGDAGDHIVNEVVGGVPASAVGGIASGPGWIGSGLVLNGSDAYLTGLAIPHQESLTWAAWIRTTNPNGGIMGLSGAAWSPGAKGIYLSGGRLKLGVAWVGGAVVEGSRLDNGQWHHVALTVEPDPVSDERLSLYVNGRRVHSETLPFYQFDDRGTTEPGEAQAFRIGHLAIPDAGFFKGEMDEVAVWRRALKPVEVNNVYAAAQVQPPKRLSALLDFVSNEQSEPGARFQLYWLGERFPRTPTLAEGQSPNIDLTIPALQIDGAESFFVDARGQRYTDQYVLTLATHITVEMAGRYGLRVAGDGAVRLLLDWTQVFSAPQNRSIMPEGNVELTAGEHTLLLEQHVNGGGQKLRVEWKAPGDRDFRPIPGDLLRAESFYFRPTNGGRKEVEKENTRPGNGRKLAGVHPGYRVTTVRPPDTEVPVGGLDVLPDGRLVVGVFHALKLDAPNPQPEPDGELWILDGVYGEDRSRITRAVVAEGLFEPVGVCVVGHDIYVSQRHDVTKFSPDGNGGYRRSVVAMGWDTNDFHQLSFGLIHQPGPNKHPGFLYLARSVGLGNLQNPPNHGAVWRIDLSKPAGSNVEVLTGGHRAPNGIGFGPEGDTFVTDNQGEWTPSNELNHILPGHFYGYHNPLKEKDSHPSPYSDRPVTGPAVHLPQDETANSPSQPLLIPNGSPYAGQMLVGDVKYGGIQRIFLEKVAGQWQGAVFRFTMGLECGINRLAWGEDGSLFVGGIGGGHASTWAWVDPQGWRTFQGLQRLTPTGVKVFDILAMRATPEGFEIEFTKPADRNYLEQPENYEVRQWNYYATVNYGGSKQNLESLKVTKATPSGDGRKVQITVPGLKKDRVVHLRIDPVSTDEETLWSTEVWYTLNHFPNRSID